MGDCGRYAQLRGGCERQRRTLPRRRHYTRFRVRRAGSTCRGGRRTSTADEGQPVPAGATRHSERERAMTDYAVINPATGETSSRTTISDADLKAAIEAADKAHSEWSRSTTVAERATLVRRIGELHVERRQRLGEIIVREMGKPIEQALGEIDFCGAIYEYYADNAESLLADEQIKLSRARARRSSAAARSASCWDHAVELPVLPGRALRRPEPRDRQLGAAQARPAVPRVGGRDRGDLPRRRRAQRARTSTSTPATSRSPTSSPIRACRASRSPARSAPARPSPRSRAAT